MPRTVANCLYSPKNKRRDHSSESYPSWTQVRGKSSALHCEADLADRNTSLIDLHHA